jgi:DNA-binding SARP family transcriptional activator
VTTSAPVRFGVLGPLEVRVEDRVVDAGPPKQRAVLGALIVDANRVVSMDRLVDQLWGGEAPAAAIGSLQAYIANLRRVLEPHRLPRAAAEVLLTQPPGYLLRVAPDALDSVRFAALVDEAARLRELDRLAPAEAVLVRALDLWRGSPLEELYNYDFAAAEVRRLEELRWVALEALAEVRLARGGHSGQVVPLERLVAQAPLRERPRALLATALYRSGRQADALDLLAQTRTLLATELGIDPGPELQRLQAAILRHDPDLSWRPPAAETAVLAGRTPPGAALSGPPSRGLVGRAGPLAALRAALAATARGGGRAVLVAGEPGIGKTRLLEELGAEAAAAGADVLWAHCVEGDAAPPFWPWQQVLRQVVSGRPADEAAGITARLAPHAEALGADLAGADPDVPQAHSRFLLCDEVCRLVLDLAATRPLLILVEDLHWADTASLDLVAHLSGRLAGQRVMVVATFRDTEVPAPLAVLLAKVARHPATERVRLTGLGSAEVAELMAQGTEAPLPNSVAAAVHQRTGGNPFFVTELTRFLASSGRLGHPDTWPVPEGVRDVIRQRVARLPQRTGTLLTVAAIAGHAFVLPVLERVSGLDEDTILDALEVAAACGLLVEDPAEAGCYRFVHALVRETLEGELSGLRRARLHARIAEAVEAAGGGPTAVVEAAQHRWLAGRACPADQTLDALLRAAELAERMLGFESAVQQLDRARGLVEREPMLADRELGVLHHYGRLLVQTRGYAAPGVEAVFARVRALAQRDGRTTELADALWGLCAARCVAADFSTAVGLGERLLALAAETGDREVLRTAHHALGVLAWHRGDLDVADEHLAEAVALADEVRRHRLAFFLEDPATSSRGFHSAVRWLRGDAAGARALRGQALALAAHEHPYTRAFALFHAANLAVYERDVEATRGWARDAIALCDDHGFALFGALCEAFDGWAAALRGEPGAERVRAAHDAVDATGASMLRHYLLGLRAEAELAEGHARQAAATLREAVEAMRGGECFFAPRLVELRERVRRGRARSRSRSAATRGVDRARRTKTRA